MRWILALSALAAVAACDATYQKDPSTFYKPEDCNNPAKYDHPDYVDECGNEL